MATSGNRLEVLAAVNFVESHFPNGQALKSAYLGGMPNSAHSHPPQHNLLLSPPGVPADKYHSGLPNYPPPGLVRVSPATPAPVHVITNETASLFGDFARYLDDGIDEDGNPVSIQLTCGICMESKLKVTSCLIGNGSSPPPRIPEDTPAEDLSILPCGHFFGANCLYEWLISADQGGCPLCRYELVYACGHDMEPLEYNSSMFRREHIPLTFPEGGLVPRSCRSCYEGCINGAAERLRHLLFPPDVRPGDLQFVNSAEILRSTSSNFKSRVQSLLAMREHYIRW
ncbi:hypothetical protein F4782DRAFT_543170 [Xylaria castorea]|nr:hypothetical protein F4782DRAFT_543170 [Xylaria castorea]